ncbi:MAG: hypothetical protein HC903_13330 [Methylacidiphilales bacterium]|nr:hypothetical protein [Candidatus Methylacidiphilales bacterium]NJR14660.1 hypothetical protein [Calothrix sp. CSU_2_0]
MNTRIKILGCALLLGYLSACGSKDTMTTSTFDSAPLPASQVPSPRQSNAMVGTTPSGSIAKSLESSKQVNNQPVNKLQQAE